MKWCGDLASGIFTCPIRLVEADRSYQEPAGIFLQLTSGHSVRFRMRDQGCRMTTRQSIIQREPNTCGRWPGPVSSASACLARFVAAHTASVAGQIVSKVALAWHRPGSEVGRSKEAARLAGGSEAVGALTTATSSSHLETACSDSPC